MVYLIRRAVITGDWGKMEEAAKGLLDCWARQPQTKGVEAWGNIAGPIAEYRFVAKFDSLADEEQFSIGLMKDPSFGKAMMAFAEVFRMEDDQLIRVM
ncbi:MAG: hypothetical protein WCG80_10535 [Spirochaetales bacterium]